MKKLISLIFVALISSQMWAAMVYAHYYTGSNNTMGKIGINMSSSWPTTSAPSSGYVYISGSSTNVRLNAEALSGYTFGGWYDETGALISSSAQYLWTYGSHTGSSKGAYAKFTATGGGSGSGGGSGTSQTKNYTVSGTNYTMNAYDLNTGDNILWGDRAIGATSTTTGGFFCQYGFTDLSSSNYCNSSNSYSGIFTATSNLPADKDVATAALGEGWRMPTRTEWNTLISKSTFSCASTTGNNVVLTANSKTITLYTADKKYNGSVGYSATSSSAYAYYWTGTRESGTDAYRAKFSKSTNASNITKTTDDAWWVYGQQVIPVYDAANYTLTVKADGTTSTNYSGKWGASTASITATKSGYTFTRWSDGNTSNPRTFKICNATYTAEFEAAKVTATFKNYDGTTLYTNSNVTPGTTPSYSGSTPTKPSTQTETEVTTYTFTGWSPALGAITSNTTYTAQFSSSTTTRYYTVRFLNYDNSELKVITDATYESTPIEPAEDPVKPATDTKTYTFTGWSPAVTTVTGNQDYVAQFAENDRTYTIRFEDYDGTEIRTDAMMLGENPVEPTDPVREGYTFSGWTPAVTEVTGDQTYRATYIVPQYDITIGTCTNGYVTLTTNAGTVVVPAAGGVYSYEEGTTININAIANRGWHFTQWSDDTESAAKRIRSIEEDITLTPTFAENTPFNMLDTWDEAACNANYNFDDVLTVTLKRSFTTGTWATLSLPFDYKLTADDELHMSVFAFTKAELGNSGNSVTIEFNRTYEIEANVPYLVVPTVTVTDPKFYGVKLETPAEEALTTDGKVEFRSSVWQQTITGSTDFYVGTRSNLRYAKAAGTVINGNRAFFRKLAGSSAPMRVRARIDGVEQEIEITEDGGIQPVENTRKYMENGILIIERNGVRYDAQGKAL